MARGIGREGLHVDAMHGGGRGGVVQAVGLALGGMGFEWYVPIEGAEYSCGDES